jgi:hypothetical protein
MGMLVGLIAFMAVSLQMFVAGLAEQAAPNPVNHPSTLELALIAIVTLAAYVALRRSVWRRARVARRIPPVSVSASSTDSSTTQPSRGAA